MEQDGEWTKISSGSVEGYVHNDYLAFGADAEALAQEYGVWKILVQTDGLRARSEPSLDGGVEASLDTDEVYYVDEEANEEAPAGWVAIRISEETLYVAEEYVEVFLDLDEAISIEEEQAAATTAARSDGRALAATYDEVELLAALIYCEAGDESVEPYEGRVSVGAVIVNRIYSPYYPDNMVDVIYQSGQFGPASSGKLQRVLENRSWSESSYQAAVEALSGVSYVGDRTDFNTYDGSIEGIIIGTHVFYY